MGSAKPCPTPLRLALLGIALALLLSQFAVAIAVAATPPNSPTAPTPGSECALPQTLKEAGEDGEARKAYLKLLEGDSPPACAREGFEELSEPDAKSENCKRGEAYEALNRDDDAIKAYEKALETNPESECAKEGLDELGPSDLTEATEAAESFTSGAIKAVGAVLVGLGIVIVFSFAFLTLARIPRLGRQIRKLPKVGRLLGPRLSIEPVADEATGEKSGAPLTASIKEYMQLLREEAAAGPPSDYDLDWPAPKEQFADFASEDPGLKSALEKASDISDQAKTVAALLSIAYTALPITRLTLSGTAAPTHDGVSLALALEENGRLAASTTIAAEVGGAEPKVPDYVQLARPAAVWTQFGVGCILARKPITPQAAQSFGLLRQGLDALGQAKDNVTVRKYFEEAIHLDGENWAAYVGLASIPDDGPAAYKLVVDALTLGLARLAKKRGDAALGWSPEERNRWLTDERHPKDPAGKRKGLRYLKNPNYYRMAYQLAVELGDGAARGFSARGDLSAETTVKRLIEDSNLMLAWYKRREYLGEGQFWKRLTPKQKALRTFLTKTILPCLEILRAEVDPGARSPAEAEEVMRALAERRQQAEAKTLAYRPLYNLACYEAKRASEDDLSKAVDYLVEALHKAPPTRWRALLSRAKGDPTLTRVVTDGKFEAELAVFEAAVA